MEQIKNKIIEILKLMEIESVEVNVKRDNSLKSKEVLNIDIEMEEKEADCFLKDAGAGLSSLQHLLRVLISKEIPENSFLKIDINGYREKREEAIDKSLEESIKLLRKNKKPIILDPMSAYERRLVHMRLAEYPDIVTQSTGEEPDRRVVIRLYP